uniref:Uncharacterized protein n=1 Tax=Homalodisca liturata TaxID=320908 RepID=A0A1B6JBI0_9HEMI
MSNQVLSQFCTSNVVGEPDVYIIRNCEPETRFLNEISSEKINIFIKSEFLEPFTEVTEQKDVLQNYLRLSSVTQPRGKCSSHGTKLSEAVGESSVYFGT